MDVDVREEMRDCCSNYVLFVLDFIRKLLKLLAHFLHLLQPHEVILPKPTFDLRHVVLDLALARRRVRLDPFQVSPEALVD